MKNVFVYLAIIAAGCSGPQTKKATFEYYPALTDSIHRRYIFDLANNNAEPFNLPSLLNGVDSFEIRIQPWHAFTSSLDLFVFKVDSIGWKGYHYYTENYSQKLPDGTTRVYADGTRAKDGKSYQVLEVTPACGWQKFADSINFFGIATLPDQDSIKNNPDPGMLDGSGYLIEIATNNSYRQLSYNSYGSREKHDECLRLAGFAGMIWRVLGDDYNWPVNKDK